MANALRGYVPSRGGKSQCTQRQNWVCCLEVSNTEQTQIALNSPQNHQHKAETERLNAPFNEMHHSSLRNEVILTATHWSTQTSFDIYVCFLRSLIIRYESYRNRSASKLSAVCTHLTKQEVEMPSETLVRPTCFKWALKTSCLYRGSSPTLPLPLPRTFK